MILPTIVGHRSALAQIVARPVRVGDAYPLLDVQLMSNSWPRQGTCGTNGDALHFLDSSIGCRATP